jgi:hypothetical protein
MACGVCLCPFAHARPHTRTNASIVRVRALLQIRTHTHTDFTLSRTHTHKHKRTHARTRTEFSLRHTHTCTCTNARAHTDSTLRRTHAHTNARARAHRLYILTDVCVRALNAAGALVLHCSLHIADVARASGAPRRRASVAQEDGLGRGCRSGGVCERSRGRPTLLLSPILSLLLSSQPRVNGPFLVRRSSGLRDCTERRSLPVQKGREGTPVPKTSTLEQPSRKPSRPTASGAATPRQAPQVRERKAEAPLKAVAVATAFTPPRRAVAV